MSMSTIKGMMIKLVILINVVFISSIVFLGASCQSNNCDDRAKIEIGNSQVKKDIAYTSPLYEKQLPVEIKNGTFYRDGKPIFFSGFDMDGTIMEPSRQGGNWDGSEHKIYSGKLDLELMDEFGLNTYQMWGTYGWAFLNRFFPDGIDDETREFYEKRIEAQKKYSENIGGCVSILDFMLNGWVFEKGYNKIKHKIPPGAFQTNNEWDDFFRFDPSNSVATEYYHADYKEYTRFVLKNGENPFIYELLNEPVYHSFSKENLLSFESLIKNRYANIENANKQWGTDFKNISDAISLIAEKQMATDKAAPGLWVEWMDFMSDILSNHLKGFKDDILSVDKRPIPKYFTAQPSGIPNLHVKYDAFDYTKLMGWFDVMTIEYGGPTYGGTQSEEENNPYAAGLNMKRSESMLSMDLARAIARGKPVCDDEMACKRFENGIRVPSHSYDLGTSLWEQVIHGISSSMIYAWGARAYEWRTYEEAKENALVVSHRGCYLQNPYNYTLEALKDLKRSRDEIDRLAEIVLPTPRTRGKVGIIFAHKHAWLQGVKDSDNFRLLQDALINLHMPYDYLVDSYLEKDKNLAHYSAILTPCLKYCPTSLLSQIEEYVRNGGVLIAFPETFTCDDYAKPTNSGAPLIGTQFEKIPRKAAKLNFTVPVEDKRNLDLVSTEFILKPANAEIFAKSDSDEPLVTRQSLGKGKVYALSFIKTKDMALSSVLGTIFREEKVEKDIDARRIPTGDIENSVELNLIDRIEKKLVHIVNWSSETKLSKITFRNPNGEWYLVDVVEWKAILSPSGKTLWTSLDIKGGIDVLLPSQRRVLILLSRAPIDNLNGAIKIADFYEKYKTTKETDIYNRKKAEEEIADANEKTEQKRVFEEVDPKYAFYVDISQHANMGFLDEVLGDGKGGWTDQGENDLRDIPVGNQTFYGVPYLIVDPVKNNGKSAIVLRGESRPCFPLEAKGIPVGKKAVNLYFLHTSAWTEPKALLFKYVIHYSDGQTVDVPIHDKSGCMEWWEPKDKNLKGGDIRIAWVGNNPITAKKLIGVGLYTYRWQNPHPELEIKSIDIVSFNKTIPLVVAITGITEVKK